MVLLSQIRGQERAVALLERALEADRVAHAYLFCGPAGCGKYTTGVALAAALNCDRAPGVGCGACGACDKVFQGIHPDVQTLERTGAAQIIPIKTIRERVIPQLGLPPHEGRARVFLAREATAFQEPAANALLKTLEEPPRRTHFVFCTTAPDQLLPTIRSRCQRVSFAALPPDLAAELHAGDETADRLVALSDALYQAAAGDGIRSLVDAAREVGADRADVPRTILLLAHRYAEDARRAAREGDLAAARAAAARAQLALDTELAVSEHHAHGVVAVEALLHRLREVSRGGR